MRDNEAVKVAAREIGFNKRPNDYIKWVDRKLNKRVSNATVTKTLGKYNDRKSVDVDNALLLSAKDFFVKCNSNIYYSKSLLERAKDDVAVYAGSGYV